MVAFYHELTCKLYLQEHFLTPQVIQEKPFNNPGNQYDHKILGIPKIKCTYKNICDGIEPNQPAGHIYGYRIYPNHHKEKSPLLIPFHIHYQVKETQQEGANPTG